MQVFRVNPKDWETLAPLAHKIAFGEDRAAAENTFDFVVVATSGTEITGYITVIELSKSSVYIQHGGAMPNVKGTVYVKRHYKAMLDLLRDRYEKLTTRIASTNLSMLKLAMSEGFFIEGCDFSEGFCLVHLVWRRP